MSSSPQSFPPPPAPAPRHLWVVGVVLVLWNAWGLFGSVAAQVDLVPDMSAEAEAYFDRQPLWFLLFLNLSPLAGVAGSVALLLQSRKALALFLAQLGVLVVATAFEIIAGSSPLLTSGPAQGSMLFLLSVLAAQILYACRLVGRGILA